MATTQLIALIIFIFGYLAIVFEHALKINKSAAAISTGVLLWLLIAINSIEDFHQELISTQIEVFEIVIFLLAAMSLVELLIYYKFFDLIQQELCKLRINDQLQFLLLTYIVFWMSAVIDNLTVTIVGIRIAMLFFRRRNLLFAGVGIVIAANAGGVFSPIGDVTTIMLWLAGKFSVWDVISRGFLPSLGMYAVAIGLLSRKFTTETPEGEVSCRIYLRKSQWFMIVLTLTTFVFPIIMSLRGLPPYFGLLVGLSIVWLMNDLLNGKNSTIDFLCGDVGSLIRQTDLASLLFFIGILLSVGALSYLGILNMFSGVIFGTGTDINRIIAGNALIGLISALVGNVPTTAITLKMLDINNPSIWVLLAYTVGTGGSLLSIGSAAGVIAMGMLGDLDFWKYLKIALVPAFLGYVAGLLIWLLQYFVFHF